MKVTTYPNGNFTLSEFSYKADGRELIALFTSDGELIAAHALTSHWPHKFCSMDIAEEVAEEVTDQRILTWLANVGPQWTEL